MVPVLKKRYILRPTDDGSEVRTWLDSVYFATDAETLVLRLCDGAHTQEQIETLCQKKYPNVSIDWTKFSLMLDWQEGVSDPHTTAPQLYSFDRQCALKRAAPSPWPWRGSRKPYIASAEFILTRQCNHRCITCPNRTVRYAERCLPREVWLDAFRQLLELGLQCLTLGGGEPVLHPAFWPLATHALTNGVSLVLETNGTLWQQEDIDRLAALGLDYVSFRLPSLNSARYDQLTRSTGDLSKVLRNLGRFHDRGVYLRVETAFDPEYVNLKDLSALIHYCYELGVEQFRLTPQSVMSDTPEQRRGGRSERVLNGVFRLADVLHQQRPGFLDSCAARPARQRGQISALPQPQRNGVRDSLAFLPDGGITRCAFPAREGRELIFGNLRTDRIRALWYSSRVDQVDQEDF